jgi:adenine deaminase
VNPAQLIYYAASQGTTTFIADPHEAANVCGKAGIDYILDETENCQANVYVMLPSCVPSAPFEDNGCRIDADDMTIYLNHSRILGLGEVMDYTAVLGAEKVMLKKLSLFQDKIIDGHAGFLNNKKTTCYVMAGIRTDHECCTFDDALREMRAGIQILVREGSAAKNLEAIIKGVICSKLPCNRLSFCTDDKHIEEIRKNGHISYNVRKAISLGLDAIEAIKITTIYTANCYGLKHLGAIAPGYQADLLVLSDLNEVKVEKVFHKGALIEKPLEAANIPVHLLNTVNVALNRLEEFRLSIQGNEAYIIRVRPGEILTKKTIEEVPVKDGLFMPNDIYQKIAVLERHHATGNMGLGIVKGFSVRGGAIASTVGHDSHNLIVIGDNDLDMYRAVKELISCGGGYTIVEQGKAPLTLNLEVMGLLTNQSYEKVQDQLSIMIKKAREMGVPKSIDPFITLSFLTLPVIPQIRITTRGLYDVTEGRFVRIDETHK